MLLRYKYTFPNSVGLDRFIRLYGNPDHFNDFEVDFKELTVKTKDLIRHTYEIAWYVYEADYLIDHKGIPGFNFKQGEAKRLIFIDNDSLFKFIYEQGHSGCFRALKVLFDINEVIVDSLNATQQFDFGIKYNIRVNRDLNTNQKGLFTRDLSDLKSMFNLKE